MATTKRAVLPEPKDLERTCKGLAALDAILCDDWEMRYYSFNAGWNKTGKERMASMRNGEGDQWFVVFAPAGVFVKAFWHEHGRAKADAIYAGLPAGLAAQRKEPAFEVDDVTWGGWHDGAWTLRGDAKPMKDELAILSGDPEAYVRYAKAYFELEVAADDVAHVLAGKKLDAKLLERLGSERTLAELKADLAEIGY